MQINGTLILLYFKELTNRVWYQIVSHILGAHFSVTKTVSFILVCLSTMLNLVIFLSDCDPCFRGSFEIHRSIPGMHGISIHRLFTVWLAFLGTIPTQGIKNYKRVQLSLSDQRILENSCSLI